MKTKVLFLTMALGASTCLLTAQEGNPPPEGQRPPGAEGGPAGPGGPGERRGPQLLPPLVAEQLNLAPEQRAQVAKLEAEVKAKMENILTPEQLQELRQMRPLQRRGGPGGTGGGGGPGSPGEQGVRPGGFGGGPGGMGGQRPVMPVVAALDLNKDGTIDAKEIAKASESLKKLDKNDDGKLTPDELLPQRGQGGPGMRGPGGPGGPPPGDGQSAPWQRPQSE